MWRGDGAKSSGRPGPSTRAPLGSAFLVRNRSTLTGRCSINLGSVAFLDPLDTSPRYRYPIHPACARRHSLGKQRGKAWRQINVVADLVADEAAGMARRDLSAAIARRQPGTRPVQAGRLIDAALAAGAVVESGGRIRATGSVGETSAAKGAVELGRGHPEQPLRVVAFDVESVVRLTAEAPTYTEARIFQGLVPSASAGTRRGATPGDPSTSSSSFPTRTGRFPPTPSGA